MPPAIVIRLELEATPVVYVQTINEAEEKRLTDWVTEAHPEYGELVALALELVDERRAA